MAAAPLPAPTDRELALLKVLWELGEGTVRDVHERLAPHSGLHFNTIQTQLRIMDSKGLVTHRDDGRAFVYSPRCTRDDVSAQFLNQVFDGAIDQLVASMLNHDKVDADELKELEKLISQKRKQQSSGKRTKRKSS